DMKTITTILIWQKTIFTACTRPQTNLISYGRRDTGHDFCRIDSARILRSIMNSSNSSICSNSARSSAVSSPSLFFQAVLQHAPVQPQKPGKPEFLAVSCSQPRGQESVHKKEPVSRLPLSHSTHMHRIIIPNV